MRRAWGVVAVVAALAAACSSQAPRAEDRRATPTSTTSSAPTTTVARAPLRVLVVGDSLAVLLGLALDRRSDLSGWDVHNAGVLGCGILPGGTVRYGVQVPEVPHCLGVPARWQRELDQFDPEVVIVLDGFWDAYDWVVDGQVVPFGTPAWDEFAAEHFGAAMETLSAGGARVIWVLSPYFRPDSLEAKIKRYHDATGEYHSALDDTRVQHLNDIFRFVAAQQGCSVAIVDSRPCVCPGDQYVDTIDGFEVRGDGVHFTDPGADRLAAYVQSGAELALGAGC